MLPILGGPETIHQGLAPYRSLFCREEGFEHVSRYVTGLILSPHKTLQGIYEVQVWGTDEKPSRRAMHEAVFEAGWDADARLPLHRQVVAPAHRGRGREVLSLDGTYAHHERGPKSWGVRKAWGHVERRMAQSQTIVTAVMANRERIDGIEVSVQQPDQHAEEVAYWPETVQESYAQMDAARGRCLERFHHLLHRLGYKKRTEMALEVGQQLEQEGHFPQAHEACDQGVLTLELTRGIESVSQHGVSEVECSRPIQWQGQGRRVDAVAAERRRDHPESFRLVRGRCRNGNVKQLGALTKVVRVKRSGRKRLVMVHEQEDLRAAPRFLRTDARHGESGRVMEPWSDRWVSEIFPEFAKQVTGLEAAQVRQEEAVKRHFRLRCLAQSRVQQAPVAGSTSERFAFAKGKSTFGQRCHTIVREAWSALLWLVASLLARGRKCADMLELLLPA
jgi:hypothetical protein